METKKKLSSDNIFLILVAGIASYLDSSLLVSLGVALPIWATQYSLNGWFIGLLSTLLTVSVAIGSFFGGYLSDKFGRSKVFNFDIFFVFVGALIVAISSNVYILLVGVIISGLASGADLPTSLTVISERVDKETYGRAISATQVFWTVGILASQFIGFLTANMLEIGPRVLFGWIALVAVINWIVRVFSKKMKRIEDEEVPHESDNEKVATSHVIKETLKNKKLRLPLILLTIFYLFWNIPANTWGSFVNYFLVTIDGRSQGYATLIALFANIVCLITNVIYVKLSDSKYRYPMMYLGIAIALISFITAGAFSKYWQVFTVSYVFYSGSTVLCGEALYKIWTQSFYSTNVRASLTGFSYGLVRILTAVFSLITPVIMAYSANVLFNILIFCTLIFGLCAVWIRRLIVSK